MISLVIFSFITGGLVQWWGYYTPFIIGGSAIYTVGAGLMTLYTVNQPDWRAYGFTIVAGAGLGLSLQNAFMSVQAVLPNSTLPIGNAVIMFSQTLA
jgi:Na+/melibiose symporter-like transporter